MGAIKKNQLALCWLMHVFLPIASFKLHHHKAFEEQRGKLKNDSGERKQEETERKER